MVSSELYSDETCSSAHSECEYIKDYELEVEQFDVGSTSPSNEASGKEWEDNTVADTEWVERYETERVKEKLHVEALQQRLDGRVAVSQW